MTQSTGRKSGTFKPVSARPKGYETTKVPVFAARSAEAIKKALESVNRRYRELPNEMIVERARLYDELRSKATKTYAAGELLASMRRLESVHHDRLHRSQLAAKAIGVVLGWSLANPEALLVKILGPRAAQFATLRASERLSVQQLYDFRIELEAWADQDMEKVLEVQTALDGEGFSPLDAGEHPSFLAASQQSNLSAFAFLAVRWLVQEKGVDFADVLGAGWDAARS